MENKIKQERQQKVIERHEMKKFHLIWYAVIGTLEIVLWIIKGPELFSVLTSPDYYKAWIGIALGFIAIPIEMLFLEKIGRSSKRTPKRIAHFIYIWFNRVLLYWRCIEIVIILTNIQIIVFQISFIWVLLTLIIFILLSNVVLRIFK